MRRIVTWVRRRMRLPGFVRTAGSSLWTAVRPLAVIVSKPVRWYFRYVPTIAWGWLPILLFAPDPLGQLIVFTNITVAFAVGQWAGSQGVHRVRVRLAVALVALSISVSVIQEWHNPQPLPRVRVQSTKGAPFLAGYIAVDGGNAYVVRNRQLSVIPTSNVESLTILEPPSRKAVDEPSIIGRIF